MISINLTMLHSMYVGFAVPILFAVCDFLYAWSMSTTNMNTQTYRNTFTYKCDKEGMIASNEDFWLWYLIVPYILVAVPILIVIALIHFYSTTFLLFAVFGTVGLIFATIRWMRSKLRTRNDVYKKMKSAAALNSGCDAAENTTA